MADDLGEAGKDLLAAASITGKYGEKPGPIKTIVGQEKFSQIHLLSNYAEVIHKPFSQWLGEKPTIYAVDVTDPTDYAQVFRAANSVLDEVGKQAKRANAELCILLSPGTPTMATVWVLLGKSRYPAYFFQTYRGKATEVRMPGDLFEEVVPDLLRDRDISLQHLAEKSPGQVPGFELIVGDSQKLRVAVGRAQRAALRDVSVLLLGESGTGKEVFARSIHMASRRKDKPFEAINCAAIPKELLESELFGHAEGAFTNAKKARLGAFARANGGTLFLDEVGECDLSMQSKLLRVLQPPPGKSACFREFYPVGADKPAISDVRLIAATNRDLIKRIKENLFREDLFYRIAVISLHLPALRERRGDIALLTDFFLKQINCEFADQEPGYRHKKISSGGMDFVRQYNWPGNVRQLYNVLVQAAVMAVDENIGRQDLVCAIAGIGDTPAVNELEQPLGDSFDLENHLRSIEQSYLQRAMEQARGVKTKAARLLGLASYQALDSKLKRLKVQYRKE